MTEQPEHASMEAMAVPVKRTGRSVPVVRVPDKRTGRSVPVVRVPDEPTGRSVPVVRVPDEPTGRSVLVVRVQPEHTPIPGMEVADVWRGMILNPREWLIRRWNWKAAVLASVLRSVIFFGSNFKDGWRAAGAAMVVEFGYRAMTSGFWGAMTQAFESAKPAWLATLSALLVIPLLSHGLELLVHWLEGTARLWTSMLSSVVFTALSTLFNLYAMRRGALLVGGEGRGFGSDLRALPGLIGGFLVAGPKALLRLMD